MEYIPFNSTGVLVQIGHWGDDYSIWFHTDPALYTMPRRHRHNSIEVNLVIEGRVGYYMPSGVISLPCHRLVMFWGSIPHQSVITDHNTRFYSLHIPLSSFLEWNVSDDLTRIIMSGGVVIDDEEEDRIYPADRVYLARWEEDINQTCPANIKQANMEICARIHRLASRYRHEKCCLRRPTAEKNLDMVEEMALFISMNFDNPISMTEVAEHVGLHPKYAMRIFHKQTGITMKSYITMLRIHQSQHMLLTTDQTVLEIAMSAGFGSSSSFYEAFHAICDCSPMEFRSRFRT